MSTTLTSAQMLAIIARGESVSLPGGIITRADQVPAQSQLDAGQYDGPFVPAPATTLQRLNTRRLNFIESTASGVPAGIGEAWTAPVGTVSYPALSATVPYSHYNLATAATLNDPAYNNSVGINWWGTKPLWQGLIIPGLTGTNIAVARFVWGLSNTVWTTVLASDTPAASMAVFRYSTAAGDANYKCVTSDGTSRTVVDSGIAPAAGVPRRFEISDDGTTTTFKIDGNIVGTSTTNRPASTAVMRQGVGVQTLEAVIKSVAFAWMSCEVQ